ncbi:MAG: hypothetical protein ACYTHJ_12480 [Planctomycetota bacterium]|jgi:hypothetical protein
MMAHDFLKRRAALLIRMLAIFAITVLFGCNSNGPPETSSNPRQASSGTESKGPTGNSPEVEVSEDLPAPVLPDHVRRPWVEVVAASGDAAGGWAVGGFVPSRNRINIDTHDVSAFSLNTSLIPIDWEKLVILNLDGRTSELVRRDDPTIQFRRDGSGGWEVPEQP